MTYYLSPIGTSCHFAYAADAPLLSLSRHFPRFSGGIYPEGGSAVCFTVFASVAKQSPGRVGSRKAYTYSTLVAGYFAYAGYNAWNNRYFSTPDIRNFLDKSYPKLRGRGLLIFDDIPSG